MILMLLLDDTSTTLIGSISSSSRLSTRWMGTLDGHVKLLLLLLLLLLSPVITIVVTCDDDWNKGVLTGYYDEHELAFWAMI